jgi:predicted nucleic acid-binding Zn ribbon protein
MPTRATISEEMSKLWELRRKRDYSLIESRRVIVEGGEGNYAYRRSYLAFYGMVCVVCGTVFGDRSTGYARFCSSECEHKYRYQRRKARGLYPKHELRDRVCVVCGASFKAKMLRAKYCSQSCRNRDHYHPRPKPVVS